MGNKVCGIVDLPQTSVLVVKHARCTDSTGRGGDGVPSVFVPTSTGKSGQQRSGFGDCFDIVQGFRAQPRVDRCNCQFMVALS